MFKKIITLLLAVVMLLSIGAVAAFAEDEIEYDGDATLTTNTVEIGKTYKIANPGTTNPAETFYLIRTGKSVSDSLLNANNMPDLVQLNDTEYAGGYDGDGYLVGEVSYTEGEATEAGVAKTFEIGLPAYNSVGIYTYTLREVNSATPGVTYWDHDIRLVITVMATDEGKFYVAAVHCEEVIPDVESEKTDNFTNVYSATSSGVDDPGLTISKTVNGNLGDRDMYFDFSVTFTAEPDMSYANSTGVEFYGGSHADNPTTVDITSLGNAPITVNFKLKHGETISFGNVPYGVTYAYGEEDYTNDGYTTTYPQIGTGVNDAETGLEITADDKSDTVDFATKGYTVTNTKEGEIDTGVILDNLPYILAIAAVILGAAIFVFKKRRTAAENA